MSASHSTRRRMIARHVQTTALVVYADHAEVAVGVMVVVVDGLTVVYGGEDIGELLLLDKRRQCVGRW